MCVFTCDYVYTIFICTCCLCVCISTHFVSLNVCVRVRVGTDVRTYDIYPTLNEKWAVLKALTY